MKNLDVRHFKLMNGDNILATVADEMNDTTVIENPVLINSSGNGVVRFTYWMPYTEENYFVLPNSTIMIQSTISEAYKDEYAKLYDEIELSHHEESQSTDTDLSQLDAADIEELVTELSDPNIKIH